MREDYKMADVRERLARRNEERLEAIDKRKNESGSKLQPEENKDLFKATFSKEKMDLENLLSQCQSIADGGHEDKQVITQYFDKLSKKCQQLQKFLADSTMFLPAYDVKLSQDKLNSLQQAINEERERLLPKKKFAFRTRKKQPEEQTVEKNEIVDDVDSSVQGQKSLDNNIFAQESCGFKGMKGQDLVMNESESSHQDIALSDLEKCTVKLLGTPSALHMNQLKHCTILCGPVSTAIFIDDCTDCMFVLACQQLRVHKTSESKFYLHVSSRAIIEDCTSVGFAPFTLEYHKKDEHFKSAGLDPKENNWSLVNDFNWLRKDEHSPNWFIIDEDKRLKWSL